MGCPDVVVCALLCLQVSVLVLKVQSVCVGMEAVGESTAVALEVGQVTPSQLGNVCLRQYLSNRSLGKNAALVRAPVSDFVSSMSECFVRVKQGHMLLLCHCRLLMNQAPSHTYTFCAF